MNKCVMQGLAAGVLVVGASMAQGAVIASDNAADPVYDAGGGWTNGDNGGTGFLAWSSIGNANGSGAGGVFIANNNAASNISTSNDSFGVYGNGGGVGQAVRPFDGALSVGQTFSIQMDNQGIDNGGTVGFGLQNSAGQNRLEYYFVGGQSNYTLNNGSTIDTGFGYTANGMTLDFTLTAADTFSFTINGGTPITGSLGNSGGIDRVRLFNANGGPDVFYNNLSIVPEPASLGLLGLAGLAVLRRRTR